MKKLLLLVMLPLGGCSVLTKFDEQPCELNAPVGQQCLAGYECVTLDGGTESVCRTLDAGTP